jgi:hypothetical protein
MTALTHKTFATAEVETGKDAGTFVALVSTYEPDRQREQVVRGAFRRSLARWRKSGRMIPLLADHDGTIGAVVGRVDPRGLRLKLRKGWKCRALSISRPSLAVVPTSWSSPVH